MAGLAFVLMVGVTALLLYKFRHLLYGRMVVGQSMLRGTRLPLKVKLMSREQLTHDTYRFRFALPNAEAVLGLPIGNCIFVDALDGRGKFTRAYTPVSLPETKGSFDLAIKIYFPNDTFPNGGRMTQHLYSLPTNECINIRGPFGSLSYQEPPGKFTILRRGKHEAVTIKKLGLIAGGSGITPMFQMIRALTSIPDEKLQLTLLFANKTIDDIIFRDELMETSKSKPDRFKAKFVVLEKAPEPELQGDIAEHLYFGMLNKSLFEEFLPEPADDTLIAVCGPPLMVSETCLPALQELGYQSQNVYAF